MTPLQRHCMLRITLRQPSFNIITISLKIQYNLKKENLRGNSLLLLLYCLYLDISSKRTEIDSFVIKEELEIV